jgi:hypothetical protein
MNEEAETKNSKKLSKGEIFWTVLTSCLALAGLVMIVLGIVCDYLPGLASKNSILTAETAFVSTMKMSYRWFGVILISGAALIAVIYLNYYAKKSDIDEERALRRQQRLQVISQSADAPAPVKEVSSSSTADPQKGDIK